MRSGVSRPVRPDKKCKKRGKEHLSYFVESIARGAGRAARVAPDSDARPKNALPPASDLSAAIWPAADFTQAYPRACAFRITASVRAGKHISMKR